MSLLYFDTIISWAKFRKVKANAVKGFGDAETVTFYNSKNIKLSRSGNGVVTESANVIITLDSRASWAVLGKMNDYLLKHEQGHYDITALAAREFYNRILNLTTPNSEEYGKELKIINDELQQKITEANINYDLQTDHSQNKTAQQTWNLQIEAEKQKANGSIDNLPS